MKTKLLLISILLINAFVIFSQDQSLISSDNSTLDFGKNNPGAYKVTIKFNITNNSNLTLNLVPGMSNPVNWIGYTVSYSINPGAVQECSVFVIFPLTVGVYTNTFNIAYVDPNNTVQGTLSIPLKLETILPIPSAPINLSLSNISSTGTTASWSKSVYTTGSSDYAVGYYVYLNGVKVATTASTTYAISGLSPGTSSSISVSAYNSKGESAKISKSVLTIPAAPSSVLVTCCSSTWYRVRCNSSIGATGYNVYWGSSVSSFDYTDYCNIYGTIPLNTKFNVFTQNSSGTSSYNTWDLAIKPAMPEVPYSIVKSNITINGATLTWNGYSYEDGYSIYINGIKSFSTTSKSITLNTLSSGINYQIDIVSYKTGVGESTKLSTTILTLPAAPTNLQAIYHDPTWYTLSWTPSIGASGYNILCQNYVMSSNTNSIEVRGFSNPITSMTIWAFNGSGNGPTSTLTLNALAKVANNVTTINNNVLINSNEEIAIYPNPATNKIIISGIKNCYINIFDINGKEVFSNTINSNNEIDISSFSKGIFIIKIKSPTETIVKSFMKQ